MGGGGVFILKIFCVLWPDLGRTFIPFLWGLKKKLTNILISKSYVHISICLKYFLQMALNTLKRPQARNIQSVAFSPLLLL